MAAVQLADGKEVEGGGEQAEPAGESHGVDQQVAMSGQLAQQQPAEQLEDQRFAQSQPRGQRPLVHDPRARIPRAMTGRAARKPASGPASPTSKRDLLEENGERILMKAPNVPIKVGAGMK